MRSNFFFRRWLTIVCSLGIALTPVVAQAAGRLVKSINHPTVYYLDEAGRRHTFPNARTYQSWYGEDYRAVGVVDGATLASYPLGNNIMLRPGKWLAKVPSAPTVYAVEQGGVVRALATPEIAVHLYGSAWPKKVVDVPEALWDNYTVGEPLTRTYELPNSIVYQIKGQLMWYWKQGVLLRPFDRWEDVVANRYAPADVVVGERVLPTRARKISGVSPDVNDLMAAPTLATQDCGFSSVRVGLLVVQRGGLATSTAAALQTVAHRLPDAFAWATRELGTLEVAAAELMEDDGLLSRATDEGGRKLTEEVPLTFYDTHPDDVDVLFLFSNFTVQQELPNHEARHILVSNAISGLGLPLLNAAERFGSRGKLKGIIVVGDLGRFDLTETTDQLRLDNLLLHELGHQWSGAAKFRDGEHDSTALLREDQIHWSYYAGFISPLGGSGWQSHGDGTYTSRLSQEPALVRRPYADLDLYLMGLLPPQVIQPWFYLEPSFPGVQGNTIRGVAKTVTIEQIVSANGKRRCELASLSAGR